MSHYRILIVVLLLFAYLPGFGQSEELKKRKAALTREIRALKLEQNKIAGNKRLSLKQIAALSEQIRLREEKISTINTEIRMLDSEIREKTNTVHSLQGQLNALKKDYAGMLRFAYKNQNAYNKLMFIFSAENFNQAYKRLKYLQQFGEQTRRQADRISGTKRVLNTKISELDRDKRSKNTLLYSEQVEKQTLSKEKTEEAQQLEKLSKDEKKLKQQLLARQKELTRINRAISAAIARELAAERKRMQAEAARIAAAEAVKAKANAASKGTGSAGATKSASATKSTTALSSPTTTANIKLSADFSANHGRLPWPVSGSIVSRFGRNKNGAVQVQNNGVDIRTSAGATVSAVFSGEVRQVLPDISGHILLIKHGSYFSVYSNLRSVSVSPGQKVSAGQTVGSVKTGADDGIAQLHFEIWKGTQPTNPEGWLRR